MHRTAINSVWLVGVVSAALLVVGTPVYAAAPRGSSNMQAVLTSGGQLYHAIRYSSTGVWNGFNNVSGAATVPGSVTTATAAGVNGDLQVLVATAGPIAQLYHAIRYSSTGAWKGFNPVADVASVPQTTSFEAMAVVGIGGQLHVLVVTGGPANSGELFHAIRFASGAWTAFNNVSGPARLPAPASVISLAAANVNGDLNVLITTSDGQLYHAIRYSSSGVWNGFNNVAGAARVPGPSTGRSVVSVAAAGVNRDLQVLITANDGHLYHAIRFTSSGAWLGFNDVSGPAALPQQPFPSVAAAGVNSDLQVLITTSSSELYHAIRLSSSGAWLGFNSVGPAASYPNSPTSVAMAAI